MHNFSIKKGPVSTRSLRRGGFTLIELLVVIAIIGILASIVMVSLTSAQVKARDAKRVADIKEIQLALETYYNDNQVYPTDIYSATAHPVAFVGKYMSTVPCDPSSPSGSCTQYAYSPMALAASNSVCGYYHLGATLEDKNNSALLQDADLPLAPGWVGHCMVGGTNSNFDGNASACTYNNSQDSTDQCYDVTP